MKEGNANLVETFSSLPLNFPQPTAYKANPKPGAVRSFEDMVANMASKEEQVRLFLFL